jgi:nucleoside-diphosphate-sugar epimerase
MPRVLVTGGTGFIGRHLVRRLAAEGHQIRCLIRRPELPDFLAPLAVECVGGDVTLPDTLAPALRGIEIVFHLAGATLPVKRHAYREANAEGTRHLAEACARLTSPPVVVFLSSLAAAGPSPDNHAVTEEDPPRPISAYGRSKLAAECNLLALSDRLPITVLRPPSVIGPGDPFVVRMFRLARRGLNLIPGLRTFRTSWIYIDDLLEALLLAARSGQRLAPGADGRCRAQGLYYVAVDEQPTVTEVAELAASVQGRHRVHTIHVPALVCRLAAAFNDVRTRLIGRTYWLNLDKIGEALAGSWICTTDKTKRELGFSCRTDLRTGFELTVQWYREQGWL